MLSRNNEKILQSNSSIARLALLVGIGLILFLFESLIPRPLPWLKPGLAHVATLMALYMFGNRAAFIVVVLRIFLGSIILGTLLNPAFVLSFVGGLAATVFMVIARQYGSSIFSIFGVSIIGSVVHNLTQLILVERIIVHRSEIFYLAPIMIISAVFTGFIVAFISHLLISRLYFVLIQKNT